jgi:type II secretory pathway component PulM
LHITVGGKLMKKQLTQEFALFWEQRDARERRMLSIAAAVLCWRWCIRFFLDPALSGGRNY